MGYFALILDAEYARGGNALSLYASNPIEAPLKLIHNYDPAGSPYNPSTIDPNNYDIVKVQQHNLKDQNDLTVAASIYRCDAK